jgi:hypothetical protein
LTKFNASWAVDGHDISINRLASDEHSIRLNNGRKHEGGKSRLSLSHQRKAKLHVTMGATSPPDSIASGRGLQNKIRWEHEHERKSVMMSSHRAWEPVRSYLGSGASRDEMTQCRTRGLITEIHCLFVPGAALRSSLALLEAGELQPAIEGTWCRVSSLLPSELAWSLWSRRSPFLKLVRPSSRLLPLSVVSCQLKASIGGD